MKQGSAVKRKDVLTRALTWMNLTDSNLSKKATRTKTRTVWLHLYELPREVKFMQMVERKVLGSKGMGKQGVFNGWEFQFGKMKRVHNNVKVLNTI